MKSTNNHTGKENINITTATKTNFRYIQTRRKERKENVYKVNYIYIKDTMLNQQK